MQKKVCNTPMYRQDKTLYTVFLQSKSELANQPDLGEAAYNEIHLLRSVRHQGLLELKSVYEDSKYIYEVFEYFKGESLYSLVESGLVLDEVQMASVNNNFNRNS
jgi:calcium-dependent protein kinase